MPKSAYINRRDDAFAAQLRTFKTNIPGYAALLDVKPARITLINHTSASAISGTFSNLADGSTVLIGPNSYVVNYERGTGNDLTLTVPEPSTWAMIGLGAAAMAYLQRRRKRHP